MLVSYENVRLLFGELGPDAMDCAIADRPPLVPSRECCGTGRGQTIIAMESSNPANTGMTARPVIQVRSISAAVALSRPKLAHETFAAAASAPGSADDIDIVGGNGIATAALSAASAVRSSASRSRHLGPRIGAHSALRASA